MIKTGDIPEWEKGGSEEIFGKENRLIFWVCFSSNFPPHMTNYNFFHNKSYQCTGFLKISIQAWKTEQSNSSADQLHTQGCWMGCHITWELFYVKCQLMCNFLWSITILANTFARHSILSFLMKILKVEISKRNKEDKFPDPYWGGNYFSLDIKREFLWHPKGVIIFCNQPKVKDLTLILLILMPWHLRPNLTEQLPFRNILLFYIKVRQTRGCWSGITG